MRERVWCVWRRDAGSSFQGRGFVRSNHSGGKRQMHNSPGKSPGWVPSDANKIIVCKRWTPLSKWVNSVSEWPPQGIELVVIQPALKAHRYRGERSASHHVSDSERSPLSWSRLLLLIGATDVSWKIRWSSCAKNAFKVLRSILAFLSEDYFSFLSLDGSF